MIDTTKLKRGDEPKRVEVVTETKTVVKEVLLRMTAAEAKVFVDFMCRHELMNRLQEDVKSAIAEQEAKS